MKALDKVNDQLRAPAALLRKKSIGNRAGLDGLKKKNLSPARKRNTDP